MNAQTPILAPTDPEHFRAAALAWAEKGFRVFPLQPGTKLPLAGSTWTRTATVDLEAVRAEWTGFDGMPQPFNIGVLCDEMIVVDVDVKHGKDGEASYATLGLPLNTLTVRTPSGGRHRYFAGPNVAPSVGKLGDGLDVRSHHSYVVAPGSWLDGCGLYTVEQDVPMVAAPEGLVALCDAPKARHSDNQAPAVELDKPEAIAEASHYLEFIAPPAIEGAGGDTTTFKVACHVRDLGVTEATALDRMLSHWNDRCSPPWVPDELARKVANAFAYAQNPPGAKAAAMETAFDGIDLASLEPVAAPSGSRWYRHGDPLPTAPLFLVPDVLPAAGTGFLAGPRNSGKSFVSLELAKSLALGEPFFGSHPSERTASIIVAFEGHRGARVRVHGLHSDPLPISLLCHDGGLSRGEVFDALAAELTAEAARLSTLHGLRVGLVVLDTLSASGALIDENDNGGAAMFIGRLARLANTLGAFALVTHHPSRDGRGPLRGAYALEGNVDTILTIEREGEAPLRELRIEKQRDGEAPKVLGAFRLSAINLGTDQHGTPLTTCRVETIAGAATVKRLTVSKWSDTVEECLRVCLDEEDAFVFDGSRIVQTGIVRDRFKDVKTGSKDRSNVAKAFGAGLQELIDRGVVEKVPGFSVEHLRLKKHPPIDVTTLPVALFDGLATGEGVVAAQYR